MLGGQVRLIKIQCCHNMSMLFTLILQWVALENCLAGQKASVTAKSELHLKYFGIVLTVKNK